MERKKKTVQAIVPEDQYECENRKVLFTLDGNLFKATDHSVHFKIPKECITQ